MVLQESSLGDPQKVTPEYFGWKGLFPIWTFKFGMEYYSTINYEHDLLGDK